MKIIYQEKENECGPCIIGMLANEIHELDLDRSDIIQNAKVSSDGITLLELEELGLKFGLQIESYECEFEELFELNKDNWYISLIRKYNGFHYVIFQKSKNGFDIYDSDKGKYFLEFKEFKSQFANLICTVEPIKFDENLLIKNKKINFKNFISLKTLGICLILELFLVGIGILLAQFFKIIMNETIGFGTTHNLFAIIVPFLIIKLIEQIINYIIILIQSNNEKLVYRKIWNLLLKCLSKHSFSFYEQQPFGTIFELDFHITNVTSFYLTKITNFIGSIIISLITFFILGSINGWFILITFTQIFASGIIIAIKYFIHKHHIRKVLIHMQNHNTHISKLSNLLQYENIYFDYEYISKIIKNNLIKTSNHNQTILNETSIIDCICEFIKFIFWVIILATGINLIINTKLISINELMYIITIQTLLVSNIDNLISFGFLFNNFKSSHKKLNGYFEIEEKENLITNFDKINNIEFIDINFDDGIKNVLTNWSANFENLTAIIGENGSGKSSILKSLTSRFQFNSGRIKINNYFYEEIDPNWLIKNVIYIDGNRCSNNLITLENIFNLININGLNNELKEIIKDTKIFETNPKHFSNGQIQITKLLFLQSINNKVILLDESISAISNHLKEKVFNNLIKPLSNKNFVIFVEHDLNLIKYANKIVEVKNFENKSV